MQVKIARSQNKTRRHGLGNHWVTGHQKLIKHYKVRALSSSEMNPLIYTSGFVTYADGRCCGSRP